MRASRAAAIAFALLLALGALFGRPEHPHFVWESIPDFWALFGFAGACLMILVFRRLGETVLQRREDYYEEERE